MSKFYVACEYGAESGRVMLGSLDQNELKMSEVRRFQNQPILEKEALQWNIPQLYQETVEGLRGIGSYEEFVESVSCSSWAADYLLFEADGSLITPTVYHRDDRTVPEMKKVLSKVPWETIYGETGVQQLPVNTLFQLRADTFWRLNRASYLMPIADAFNYLLAGVPRIEASLASTMQLYNPVTHAWSDRLFHALHLPRKLFPPVVGAGTELGALRPELAKETGLDNTRVISSCSHEFAAALAGLPVIEGEDWAFLRPGASTVMGVEVAEPIINDAGRLLNFTNEIGYGNSVHFHKQTVGLWILEECRRFWEEKDRQLDQDLLAHLAGSSTPLESLINPEDPRFLEPGDMPLKIQGFCRETNQPVPRKPGAIARCVLESLALLYRKTLREIEALTGTEIKRLYVFDGSRHSLLNYFTANALQIPVVLAPTDATSIGNVIVQAVSLGHLGSLSEARDIVRRSFKMETILPHAAAWDAAYDRLASLLPV